MSITITIDEKACVVEEGEMLAGVMLREGFVPFRKHPVDNSPRAPFCMMGVCFECLVEVSGQRSVQACLTPVSRGMRVKRNFP